jgi:Bor protein
MRSECVRRTAVMLALAGSAAAGTGCFHSIITTDLPPSTEVYHEGFKPAFIYGLVPAQVDGSKYCAGRRWARVETQYSILNWVVGAVTGGIFTPMDVRVTCAASGAMRTPDGPTLKVAGTSTDTERNDAFALALTLAKESGTAVYLAF